MNIKQLLAVILLTLALVAITVDYLYLQHKTRNKFVEIQNLLEEENALNSDWGRLQIAHSTLVNNNRIEKKAKRQLKMKLPKSEQIINIKR